MEFFIVFVVIVAFGFGFLAGKTTGHQLPSNSIVHEYQRVKTKNETLSDQLDKANKRVTFYQHRHREIVKAASEIQGLADKVELEDETGFTEDDDDGEEEEHDRSMIIAFNSQDPYGGNFS